MSSFTAFDRSSCAVTPSDSASSAVTLAAVQDPAGRRSSASPDGVAISRGGNAKIRIPSNGKYLYLAPCSLLQLTCLKTAATRPTRLIYSKIELHVADAVLVRIGLHL